MFTNYRLGIRRTKRRSSGNISSPLPAPPPTPQKKKKKSRSKDCFLVNLYLFAPSIGVPTSGRQRSPGDVGWYVTDRSYVTQRYGVPAGRSLPDSAESPGFHGQVGRQGVHLLQGERQCLISSCNWTLDVDKNTHTLQRTDRHTIHRIYK